MSPVRYYFNFLPPNLHLTISSPIFSSLSPIRYRRYLSEVSETQLNLVQSRIHWLIYLNIWGLSWHSSQAYPTILSGLIPRSYSALYLCICAMYFVLSYSQRRPSFFISLRTTDLKMGTMCDLREILHWY